MKGVWLLLLVCICQCVQAQLGQDVAANRTVLQKRQAAKQQMGTMPKSFNIAAKIMAHNVKSLLNKKAAQSGRVVAPAPETIHLEAVRENEETILLQWNAPLAGTSDTYIIERRFGDPHGDFDSVGTLKSHSTDPLHQLYKLLDKNDFQGQTYYRIKLAGQPTKKGNASAVMVRGYQKGMRVSNGTGISGSITITLHKFKITPNTELLIRDANGSLVYQKKNVFFINSNTLQLTDIQLPKGTYQIEVVNNYNTGINTFTIR